ncbi:MAG: diguanylate cyclase, partial [Anaerovoracaceae bacterium]
MKKDYQIIEAKNGKECLDILNTEENIAVVLLDIIMPVVDGYEVLAAMRKEGKFAKIPVIVTSGQSGEKAEVKALALGANDYVHKPYNPDNIKHRVANTLYLCETAAIVNSAQKDMLTGAYNKEYFYLQAKEMIRKNPDKHYDIFCCDIERFKLVNDLYGVQTGDQLLKYLADMLVDFVGTKGICGRLGGDVFAGLIEQLPQYEESRFKEALDYINQFDVNLNILLRYGIYRITDPTVPVNIMCDRANLAKQSIKGKYGVYFAYYNDQVRTKLLEEEFISSNMKTALKEKQFQIYFQPKYDLKTEEIVGAEALVRWFHPEKGVLSPGYFIPIFEKNGFITDLDF